MVNLTDLEELTVNLVNYYKLYFDFNLINMNINIKEYGENISPGPEKIYHKVSFVENEKK